VSSDTLEVFQPPIGGLGSSSLSPGKAVLPPTAFSKAGGPSSCQNQDVVLAGATFQEWKVTGSSPAAPGPVSYRWQVHPIVAGETDVRVAERVLFASPGFEPRRDEHPAKGKSLVEVPPVGIEPTAFRLRGEHSNQLS
jgi:hypothetical protein